LISYANIVVLDARGLVGNGHRYYAFTVDIISVRVWGYRLTQNQAIDL